MRLGSRFTAIRKKKQGKLWKDWKLAANYYLHGAAKPLYLGIALADRSDLPRTIRQELQYLGIFIVFLFFILALSKQRLVKEYFIKF